MKTPHFILLVTVLMVTNQLVGQVHIEKRKHLKGYHIDIAKSTPKQSDFKIADDDRLTIEDLSRLENRNSTQNETVKTVVRPMAESSTITFVDDSNSPETLIGNSTETKNHKKIKKDRLVTKQAIKLVNKAQKKVNELKDKVAPKAAGDGSFEEIAAYIGFACGILAVFGFLSGGLLLFALPGIIFSLLGMNSEARRFAYIGLVLSLIVLLIILLLIVLIITIFSI